MSDETINSTTAKRFVGDILRSWRRSREIREAAKEEIRPDLEDQSEQREALYKAAEDAGLPLLALKLEVARQKDDWENDLKKKLREAKAGSDTVETADAIREALGGEKGLAGSPLGDAIVRAAPKQSAKKAGGKKGAQLVGEDTGAAPKTGADDDSDLRGDRQREQEALRKAETEERLAGMKTLDAGARPH